MQLDSSPSLCVCTTASAHFYRQSGYTPSCRLQCVRALSRILSQNNNIIIIRFYLSALLPSFLPPRLPTWVTFCSSHDYRSLPDTPTSFPRSPHHPSQRQSPHSRWTEDLAPGNIGLQATAFLRNDFTGSIFGIPSHESHEAVRDISSRFTVTLGLSRLDVIILLVPSRSVFSSAATDPKPAINERQGRNEALQQVKSRNIHQRQTIQQPFVLAVF
jgi:hypothetical protein